MAPDEVARGTDQAAPADTPPDPPSKGRLKRTLMPVLMRYGLTRRGVGIYSIYRNTGGSLLGAGLAYAALFALIPALVLVVAGLTLIFDDPSAREDAIDLIIEAFPALQGLSEPAIDGATQITALDGATEVAAIGSIVAIIGFAWAASGLYLNLTRAMERFFPGERMSGMLARLFGILLVLLVIVGVVAAVFVSGVLTVVARALAIDAELVLTVAGAAITFALATGLTYGIYRVMPSAPPAPSSARLPALLVGATIGVMTLFYGIISPWLVSGFQMFGVAASIFVALVWLRVVFLAMMLGAAMAGYRDHVAIAVKRGLEDPDAAATRHVLELEAERAAEGARASAEARAREAGAIDDADEPSA